LLLATFLFKAAKSLYAMFKSKQMKLENGDSGSGARLDGKNVKKSGNSGNEKTLCRICYDDIKEKSSTKCGHTFCWSCIIKTLEMS
jgi:late competence protein required for DNA uptake (superfamily II DNA/RNA helicase)